MPDNTYDVLIVGAGPAGLMAADTLADANYKICLIDGKPSFARKLLMAGKSGLNLTKDEPLDKFIAAYGDDAEWLAPYIKEFGPTEVANWARSLDQEIFTGSSKRVFPKAMKASPLLRAWLTRLREKNIQFETGCYWQGWHAGNNTCITQGMQKTITSRVTILALGGGSWARLGSDGQWVSALESLGAECRAFAPSNMGFGVEWTDHMRAYFGQPIKPVRLHTGKHESRGEIVLTSKGIEGSGIYALSCHLRRGDQLYLDLCPDQTHQKLADKLANANAKNSRANLMRKVFRLSPAKAALVNEFAKHKTGASLIEVVKKLPVPLTGAHPIDEAISTAGGVVKSSLTSDLMLKDQPGVFCAGEMIDWDAPTGGYLLTACLATGKRAANGAIAYLSR